MAIDRRSFFARTLLAGSGLALADRLAAADPLRPKPVLRIASQEGIIPGGSLEEKVQKMQAWGFDAIEVWGGGLPGRVKEVQDALANSKIRMSAVCAGFDGVMISEDPALRRKCADSMKEIVAAAGALESTGLICVPAFNGQTKLANPEGRKVLLDLLPELGDAAAKAKTRILLEPLNRGEAFFLRQLADAASICRDVNHPAVSIMGDFYHMSIEETSDLGAFLSAGKYLHHVHLASRARNLPGQDERSFVNGFLGLKLLRYQDFVSLECGVLGDRAVEIPKSVEFLRRQWEEADTSKLLDGTF